MILFATFSQLLIVRGRPPCTGAVGVVDEDDDDDDDDVVVPEESSCGGVGAAGPVQTI